MPAILRVRQLKKTYESEGVPVRALRGVNLTLEEGEFVAVMGPSGSGKSTLLNLVAGLETPTDGEVVLADISLRGMGEAELARVRRQHVGFVFQQHNLLEGATVFENVVLPGLIAGASRRDAEHRARELLDLLGLTHKAREFAGLLSGGERQRVAVARALVNRPSLLLADEPTGALDSQGGAEVLGLLRRLHSDGQSILLVTHDAGVAEAGDRLVRLRDGRLDSDGEPGEAVVAGDLGLG